MDEKNLVEDMKRDVLAVASSIDSLPWEAIKNRYSEQTKVEPERIIWGLMSAYMTGKEFKDNEMTDATKKILLKGIPDLEARLPYYEVMFGIMDKGRFYNGTDCEAAGPWSFELQPKIREELSDYLAQQTGLDQGTANWAVGKLSREMGYLPGAQYHTEIMLNGVPPRTQKIVLICTYLHKPLSSIVTVTNKENVADMHYESITERLKPDQKE